MYKTPGIARFLLPKLIWKIPGKEKKVYLTFDDGPHPEITPEVLNILNKFNAKATFFCVGDNVKKYPEVFKKILNNGHSVGNHTFNHLNGRKTENQIYFDNITLADKYINSKLFRPPYGQIKISQYKVLNKKYKIIMWDVLSGDFLPSLSKEKCLEKVIKYTKSGSIIVFHDSLKTKEKVLYVLPGILKYFKNINFKTDCIKV